MRDFFQKNRRLFLLLTVLAAAFVLISFHVSRTTDLAGLTVVDRIIFLTISPFQRAVTTAISSAEIVWYNYIYLVKLKEKNEVMGDRIDRLEMELARLREKARATDRLAKLLLFKENNPYDVRVARIIGFDSSGYFKMVTLDKGTADGVSINNAVVTAKGVVGRIVKVQPSYSQVLLLIDYNSSIDAIVQRTREKGMVIGQGGTICEMKYVDRHSDVKIGDTVITSGVTGIFPTGLIIGVVTEVEKEWSGLFQDVKVKPAVQMEKLEEVLIVLKEKK